MTRSLDKKPAAILFDLDGTLVDSFDAHIDAWLECGRQHGVALGRDILVRTFGGKNSEIIPLYWESGGATAPNAEESLTIANHKEALFREIAARSFPALSGSRELLRFASGAGYLSAIASNAPRENVEFCAAEFAPHRFDTLVSGDMVTKGKPDPAIFLLAAERLSVRPEQCWVIEDSPAGVQAAIAANMQVIAIESPVFDPARLQAAHWIVQRLGQIEELIRTTSENPAHSS